MDIKLKAKIGILGITLIWALAPSFLKIALSELETFNLIAFRFIIAFVILSVLFYKRIMHADTETCRNAFLISIVLFLGFATMTFGIRFTTASKAGFLTSLSVIFVPFLTFFIFGRKPEARIIAGTAITGIGVGFLTLKGNLSMNVGDLLCLLSSVLFGLHAIMTEKFASKCEPIVLTIVQMGLVGIYSFLVSLLLEKPHLPNSGSVWISIIVLAIFCTAVGFLVQTLAQKHISSEETVINNALSPLFSLLFASYILNETMSVKETFGAVLLLGGVIIAQLNIQNIKQILDKRRIKDDNCKNYRL